MMIFKGLVITVCLCVTWHIVASSILPNNTERNYTHYKDEEKDLVRIMELGNETEVMKSHNRTTESSKGSTHVNKATTVDHGPDRKTEHVDVVRSRSLFRNSPPCRRTDLHSTSIMDYSMFAWMKDDYVMSITIPIIAGIGSAVVIIILLKLCKCGRSLCHKRSGKRQMNNSVKQMRLADRMKLLAETSDEEF